MKYTDNQKKLKVLNKLDTSPLMLAIIVILIWPFWLIGSMFFIPLTYRLTRNYMILSKEYFGTNNEGMNKLYEASLILCGKAKLEQNINNKKNKNKKR